MKIAIIHDDFVQFGGAENLVLAILEIWPEATLYTSVISKKWKKTLDKKNIKYKTSFLQKFPFKQKLNRYYSLFLFHILAFESFDLTDYDVVISVSARYSHGVITSPNTLHICYMNSPGRMFWEPFGYFENEKIYQNSKIREIAKTFMALPLSFIRNWDYTAAQRVDTFIANSKVPQQRIRKYYKRKSHVIHPFVDLQKIQEIFKEIPKTQQSKSDYFVVLSRLLPWKKIEIAIKACNEINSKLVIIGSGPDENRLKNKYESELITFAGYVSEEEKYQLLLGSKALIVTQYEDFGIVPLEAMAVGKPVIAYKKGGVLETVLPGVTGVFYEQQNSLSLSAKLADFDSSKYLTEDCINQAHKFSKSVFKHKIKEMVANEYTNFKNKF